MPARGSAPPRYLAAHFVMDGWESAVFTDALIGLDRSLKIGFVKEKGRYDDNLRTQGLRSARSRDAGYGLSRGSDGIPLHMPELS